MMAGDYMDSLISKLIAATPLRLHVTCTESGNKVATDNNYAETNINGHN